MNNRKVLIIIPAYNEEENIERVIENLKVECKDYDYLVINDCSKDNTGKILDEKRYNHIDLPVNLGLTGGVQLGYKYAVMNGYDCAIQFDGDGQHLPEYIPRMVEEIEAGSDIVIGSRFVTEKKPWSLRMLGSRVITFFIKLTTGKTIKDPTSGMRMLNRKMLIDYAYNMNRKPEPDTLAYQLKRGYKAKEIQVKMEDRLAGTSIYAGLGNSIHYMLNAVITILFLN